MNRKSHLLLAVMSVALGATHFASAAIVTVNSTSGPWVWAAGGLNTNYQYGVGPTYASFAQNPAVIIASVANGLPFSPGDLLTFGYVSGTWSYLNGASPWPFEGPNGDPSTLFQRGTSITNSVNYPDSPEFYVSPSQGQLYPDELVGVFADASGAIVGTPLAIPCQFADVSFVIPPGASQFQLGTSDVNNLDNSGSLVLRVTEVPEPSSLLALSLGGSVLLLHRRRRAA